MKLDFILPLQIVHPVRGPVMAGLWMTFFYLAGAMHRRPFLFWTRHMASRRSTGIEAGLAGISNWLLAHNSGNIREGPD